MSHIAIDYPGEVIHWFASYPEVERSRPVIGECAHACRHMGTAVVGWGPDLEHYELLICDSDCEGNCRGWCVAPGNFLQLMTIEWKLLGPVTR